MDMTAFSHGQTQSKLWLCDQLEQHVSKSSHALIMGSWYNVLGFLLLARNSGKYNLITGMDKDQEAIDIANRINDGWMLCDDKKVRNVCQDVHNLTSSNFLIYDLIINTSVEHMSPSWYENVASDQLVCLQSSNMVTADPNWNIIDPNPTMAEFKSKYPMSQILFEGEKLFDYGHLVYTRYMLIGRK